MKYLNLVVAWVVSNPVPTIAIVAYFLANVAPRPHPENMTGWKRAFWTLVDRVCVLTADKLPGNLKWLFAPSPSPALASPTPAAPPPDKKESGS